MALFLKCIVINVHGTRESPGAAVLVGMFVVCLFVGLVWYCLFFFSLKIMSRLKAMKGDAI